MKFITVNGDKIDKSYGSSITFSKDDSGENKKVEKTEDEELQECYQSLIEDIRRKEFNVIVKAIILTHFGITEDGIDYIEIKAKGKNREHYRRISIIDPWENESFDIPGDANPAL